MKKLLCLVLALVLCLSMIACGGSKKTTITFWSVPIIKEELMQEFVDEFNASQEDVEVVLEFQTWDGIANKLQIALTGGDTPDIYLDGAARTAGLPALDVLAPVDDVFNSFTDWSPSVTSFGMLGGTHYLIPATQIGTSSLTVNVTLAKELGVYDLLPEDRMSWDLEDFYQFCKAATEAGADRGIKGTCLYAGSSTSDDAYYSFMLSNGGLVIDKENGVSVANSAACVEAIEVLGKIVAEGYCLDGAALLDSTNTSAPFYNGQYVLAINSQAPNVLVELGKMKAEGYIEEIPEIRTYGFPHPDGAEMNSACWGANGLAIFKNEDEKVVEASKAFAKYLMGNIDFIETVWAQTPNYSPSRDCGATFHADNPMIAEEAEYRQQLTAKYANFSFGILDSYWSEVRNNFYPEMQALYSGEKTAQEAMDSFAAKVDAVLANQ